MKRTVSRHLKLLCEAIKSGIERSHPQVLNLWLDRLEERLTKAESVAELCSYQAGLYDYVYFKIQTHHFQKRRDHGFAEERGLFGRFSDCKTRMIAIHDGMYDSVCQKCVACESRVHKWPVHTKFKAQ